MIALTSAEDAPVVAIALTAAGAARVIVTRVAMTDNR
jgi:hypothetical protein